MLKLKLVLMPTRGQPLLWPTSNKSYRPLTILALRMQFSVGNRILRGVSQKRLLYPCLSAPALLAALSLKGSIVAVQCQQA